METDPQDDFRRTLQEIGKMSMPFGLFGPEHYPPSGVPIYDLPIEYLAWFAVRGFPKGKLGKLMQMVYETRAAGCDGVFDLLRQARGGRFKFRKKRRTSFEFGD